MRIYKKKTAIILLSIFACSLVYVTKKSDEDIDDKYDQLFIHLNSKDSPNEAARVQQKRSLNHENINPKEKIIFHPEQKIEKNDFVEFKIKPKVAQSSTTTTTTTTTTTEKFVGDKELYELHKRVLNKITDEEVIEFYSRERESEKKFNKVLDIKHDRELLSTLFPSRHEKSDRVTDQLRVKLNVTDKKTILIIGGLNENNKKLIDNECNVQACDITTKVNNIKDADVILYKDRANNIRSKDTKPHQVFAAFQIESAGNYGRVSYEPMLNWTASYRHDSVLNAPYGRFQSKLSVTNLPEKPERNFAETKTKLIAWFVSNCGGSNNRIAYAKELQKYIPIDIYGGCGPLKCNRRNKDCFKQLKNDYKFYLSFENTNCEDYITEKLFWNAYLNDIVPVVMGAHENDYKRSAPPRSFIHVDWFESPQQLANYLNFLDQNDDFYNSYFLWTGTGEFINTKFVCRLCAMAHLAPHFPMWYKDVNHWWSNTNVCERRKQPVGYATWKGRDAPDKLPDSDITYGYDRR